MQISVKNDTKIDLMFVQKLFKKRELKDFIKAMVIAVLA